MKVLNYTGLKKREKTIYSIAGATLPAGGISLNLFISICVCEVIFNIIGLAISKWSGIPYVKLAKDGGNAYSLGMIFIIAGLFVGYAIYKVKIKGHPIHLYIYEACKLFFEPKYTDIDGNKCNDLEVIDGLFLTDDDCL